MKFCDELVDGVDGVLKFVVWFLDGFCVECWFYSMDMIVDVYDFVDTLEEFDEVSYSLVINFFWWMFVWSECVFFVDVGVYLNGVMFV